MVTHRAGDGEGEIIRLGGTVYFGNKQCLIMAV